MPFAHIQNQNITDIYACLALLNCRHRIRALHSDIIFIYNFNTLHTIYKYGSTEMHMECHAYVYIIQYNILVDISVCIINIKRNAINLFENINKLYYLWI